MDRVQILVGEIELSGNLYLVFTSNLSDTSEPGILVYTHKDELTL